MIYVVCISLYYISLYYNYIPVKENNCILKVIGGSFMSTSTPSYFSLPHFTRTTKRKELYTHSLSDIDTHFESTF